MCVSTATTTRAYWYVSSYHDGDAAESNTESAVQLALEPSFSVVRICWNGGQASTIHDHGSNTRSWAKVLDGTLEMRRYSPSSRARSANPAVMDEKHYRQGECLMETEYTGLHKLGNAPIDNGEGGLSATS